MPLLKSSLGVIPISLLASFLTRLFVPERSTTVNDDGSPDYFAAHLSNLLSICRFSSIDLSFFMSPI